MRSSLTAAAFAASTIAFAPLGFVSTAHADPAYTPAQVIEYFKAAKAKTRSICFGTAADCPEQGAKAAKFDLLVNFEFDSDQLTKAAKENLDQFAAALRDPALKGQKFEIDGHTDATGAEDYNLGLSQRRAKGALAYLAAQGVDAKELTAKGFGKSSPRDPDPFSPNNRRVEAHLSE
jgi:outer membrane protein OmpA-like peptidoglycan-associated protein